MSLTPRIRQSLLFALLCAIWGSIWIALKAGAMNMPPGFFSGARWAAAGVILLTFRRARGHTISVPTRLLPRLAGVAFLMVGFNALLLLYSLRHVGSGLAAIIEAALTPLSLVVFAVLLGQEQAGGWLFRALALGIAGILMLFGPTVLAARHAATELIGGLGVIVSCISYAAGTVLSRPLTRTLPPAQVAAVTSLLGGLMLLAICLPFEPGAWAALDLRWGTAAWAAWLYLLFCGSLGGTVIYFMLVRDWGASRVGTYAFVTPVIAVLLGAAVYDEHLRITDLAGMVLLLGAAWLVLRRR